MRYGPGAGRPCVGRTRQHFERHRRSPAKSSERPGSRLIIEAREGRGRRLANARSSDSGRRTSPSTISTSRPFNAARLSPFRTIAERFLPGQKEPDQIVAEMSRGAGNYYHDWCPPQLPSARYSLRRTIRGRIRWPAMPALSTRLGAFLSVPRRH